MTRTQDEAIRRSFYPAEYAPDWEGLGCKRARRVAAQGSEIPGRAAWRLRAPRRSRLDWVIEAAHCPYLGRHPYNHGNDAWRLSIQEPDYADRPCEVGHLVAESEAEAFESVAWLSAVLEGRGQEVVNDD